jgi:2OG-Fe(II) oxygenase superfamily
MSELSSPLISAAVAVKTDSPETGKELDSKLLSSLPVRLALPDTIENLRASYQNAAPFPHLVLDNLFEASALDGVLSEIPPISDKYFFHHDDEHQARLGLKSAVSLGKKGFELVSLLHSAAFLYLLSEITGIWGLLPDPYLQGGGYHVVASGGRFDIHIDRLTDYTLGLRRRLAFIIYLNHGWKAEYGGNLELWDKTGTQCERSVEPFFNRTIMFEVADKNYHGHPHPMTCPQDECRKSFMIYYHTVGQSTNIDMRSSVWAPSFYSNPKLRLRRFVRDLTPPIISRYVRERRLAKATQLADASEDSY